MIHDSLTQSLLSNSTLTPAQVETVKSYAQPRSFKKGEFFLRPPAVCNEFAYLVSGLFRYYTIDPEGEEVTAMFMREGDYFTDLESLLLQTPTEGFIQAETDCETCIFSKAANEELKEKISEWSIILKTISQRRLLEQLKLSRQLMGQDALSAYRIFRKRYPTITDRAPDHHIASFLGISKFTLSRIKAKVDK